MKRQKSKTFHGPTVDNLYPRKNLQRVSYVTVLTGGLYMRADS